MDAHSNTRTFATLRIIGKALNPNDVTLKLQLTPSETKRAGDPRGQAGQWPHGYWELSSKEQVHSADLADHIAWLVAIIESSSPGLRQLQLEGLIADIFCFWETSSSQGGITINADISRRIGQLNLPLGIDIYFAD